MVFRSLFLVLFDNLKVGIDCFAMNIVCSLHITAFETFDAQPA